MKRRIAAAIVLVLIFGWLTALIATVFAEPRRPVDIALEGRRR